jgi:non-specific serine/threonine protein kinase
VLSVEQIAARLEDALQLLTEGKRTAPQRHQTLRATLDWSHDLLTEEEQVLFKRLSVFAGGFALEAAEAVCAGDDISSVEILNLLRYLVDKSLIVKQVQGIEARYWLLEPIRQYAHKKLFESDDVEAVYTQQLTYFLSLAERAAPELKGHNQVVWFERLEKEHNNLRAALGWALKRSIEISRWKTEAALRMSNALVIFWGIRGYVNEGRQWLQQALQVGRTMQIHDASHSEQVCYGHALNWASYLAWWQGDGEVACTFAKEGLLLFRKLGDRRGIAFSLFNLGAESRLQGDYTEAQKLLEESLALRRELGDSWGIADSLHKLGIVVHARGNYARAQQLFEESLIILRRLGDTWSMADALNKMGMVAHAQGNYVSAQQLFEESLMLRRKLDDKWGIAASLNSLGILAYTQGDYTRARKLYEESLMLARDVGDKRGVALSQSNLGFVTQRLGNYAAARKYLEESLIFLHTVGNKLNIADNLSGWISLALAQKRLQRAAKLSGAVAILLESMGAHLNDPEYNTTVAALQTQLDEATFAAAWAEGKAMSTEQAIAFALQED